MQMEGDADALLEWLGGLRSAISHNVPQFFAMAFVLRTGTSLICPPCACWCPGGRGGRPRRGAPCALHPPSHCRRRPVAQALVNLGTGASENWGWTRGSMILSEVASLQMEFRALSLRTGQPIYDQKATRVLEELRKQTGDLGGLMATMLDRGGRFSGGEVCGLWRREGHGPGSVCRVRRRQAE